MCSCSQKLQTLQCLSFGCPYQTAINIQLFFGLGESTPGHRITEEEFTEFFLQTILPLYPNSTTYTATGYYTDSQGIPQNNLTKVVQILTRESTNTTKAKVASISQQFVQEFGSENKPFVTLQYSNADFS
jgi:hypothetical protein